MEGHFGYVDGGYQGKVLSAEFCEGLVLVFLVLGCRFSWCSLNHELRPRPEEQRHLDNLPSKAPA